jgi:hypothetical protein
MVGLLRAHADLEQSDFPVVCGPVLEDAFEGRGRTERIGREPVHGAAEAGEAISVGFHAYSSGRDAPGIESPLLA